MPQTDPILPGQGTSQDNVMMMEPVRIESSVPVVPKITRWPNPSMVLGRIGQARRSDRTRSAARRESEHENQGQTQTSGLSPIFTRESRIRLADRVRPA